MKYIKDDEDYIKQKTEILDQAKGLLKYFEINNINPIRALQVVCMAAGCIMKTQNIGDEKELLKSYIKQLKHYMKLKVKE